MARSLRLAVFVSGEGTLFEALADAANRGNIPVRMVLVVSDRDEVPALKRAAARDVPSLVAPVAGGLSADWAENVTRELRRQRVDLILLAGFRSILPEEFLRDWSGRVVNVHPSLLPRFGGPGMYGRRVLAAVLASGETESGATVHTVIPTVDAGPILAVERISVLPNDTPESLRERLRPAELRAISDVLRRIADGRLPLPLELDAPAGPGP